jgi:Zn-dependent protease/predicted transcriptional regulator
MNESVHLGRVSGIRLGANWSLFPILFLVAWTLAATLLPSAAPGYTTWGYWLFGLLTAAAFYACLLAHELAHALVARRHGVQVKGIVLWLFGGVAQLQSDTPTARAELQVAAAGPAASLAIAGIMAVASWLLGEAGISSLLVSSLGWLAGVNLLLAAFNLLPAFPLDGGRILRAVLWRRWGDRLRATTVAARVGTAGGFLLIAVGIFEFLTGGGGIGGIWLALIGWFITVAARQQQEQVRRHSHLGVLRVRDAMTSDPLVVPATTTVGEAIERYVRTSRFSSFPIGTPDGRIVGLTTAQRMAWLPSESRSSAPVTAGAATPGQISWCGPDDPLFSVAARMNSSPDRRVLVVEDGHLVGILSPSDVARALRHAELFGKSADEKGASGSGRVWPGAGRGVSWGPASQS